MDLSEHLIVIDKNGVRGLSETVRLSEGSVSQVLIRLDDDRLALVPFERLVPREDGSYYLPASLYDFERHVDPAIAGKREEEALVIPVVEEEIHIGKRRVETGKVRIRKTVHEKEEQIDIPLIEEEVEVRRVPVNRPVDGPVSVRYEGDTMILPLLKEELVVQKRLVLTEELYITKKRKETYQPESVTVRAEEVSIERVDPQE